MCVYAMRVCMLPMLCMTLIYAAHTGLGLLSPITKNPNHTEPSQPQSTTRKVKTSKPTTNKQKKRKKIQQRKQT